MILQSFVDHFHLDQSAVELVKNKSKKPQIRLLDDHTFTILLDIKYRDSQTVVTEGVYLFCGKKLADNNPLCKSGFGKKYTQTART